MGDNQQEYFLKMQMLGQEAERLEQQIQAIEQQISEMQAVRESITALKDGKQKEILANLGKGIFVPAEIKEKELLVNVGKNIIVKKSPEETTRVIDDQIKKLMEGKNNLVSKIGQLQEEMQHLLLEVQKHSKHEHECECGEADCKCEDEECDCEEPCDECECGKNKKK